MIAPKQNKIQAGGWKRTKSAFYLHILGGPESSWSLDWNTARLLLSGCPRRTGGQQDILNQACATNLSKYFTGYFKWRFTFIYAGSLIVQRGQLDFSNSLGETFVQSGSALPTFSHWSSSLNSPTLDQGLFKSSDCSPFRGSLSSMSQVHMSNLQLCLPVLRPVMIWSAGFTR